jgi:orotate phosphoribosyltransferase
MMPTLSEAKSKLLSLLRDKSVSYGEFALSSGAKSTYYVDCKLTTLDPEGAWLVGQVMYSMIQTEASARNIKIDAVGGLTIGADPIAIAVGMYSFRQPGANPIQTFIVRKTPKSHGQAKLIEGNFNRGDMVVVIDDVITRGDSTLNAIEAVRTAGGEIAFVAVLVDRQEGGREKIENRGYRVVTAFERNDLIDADVKPQKPDCVPA